LCYNEQFGVNIWRIKTTTLRDSSTKEMKIPNASIYISSGERMSKFPFSEKYTYTTIKV